MKKGVQRIYGEVAAKYDLVNHLMTFGLDIVWRRKTAAVAASHTPSRVLDVCCGTADMAKELSRKVPSPVRIYGADFSLHMLQVAGAKRFDAPTAFVLADVSRLPFPDNTFDLLGISFATRNLNSGPEVLGRFFREFLRVLKPNGVLLHLETSQPRWRPFRAAFHGYVKHLVRPLGHQVSGSAAGYQYLAHTVPRFYSAETLTGLLQDSGFVQVSYRPFLWRIAALHTAHKAGPA
jgi:demethylmenaquinone methyltransferase/2-methoxy-6-polyprenyl-1,4-benzoquinol methylase